jgi:protein TonB
MSQPSQTAAPTLAARLRSGAGRRTLALGLAILVEVLLLLLLLSLGLERQPGKEEGRTTVVSLANDASQEKSADAPQRAPEQPAAARPAAEEPPPEDPAQAPAARQNDAPAPAAPAPAAQEAPPPLPDVPSNLGRPAPAPAPSPARRGAVYGPPAPSGSSSSLLDSEIVGTAPNGEPLYAASWYRRPTQEQLRGYLSTANGPGWGLIACRTVADYRVEDCVALSEYPQGAQINRAVLAAAWEFRVRPPRRGGRVLVGSWVRIRIDYGIERRP